MKKCFLKCSHVLLKIHTILKAVYREIFRINSRGWEWRLIPVTTVLRSWSRRIKRSSPAWTAGETVSKTNK